MTGSFTNYGEGQVLANVVNRTFYIAYVTVMPTDASTGDTLSEPSGNGYARKSMPSTDWGTPTLGNPTTVSNTAVQTMAVATGSQGTIVGYALCDALTGGNVWAWGSLNDYAAPHDPLPQVIASGNALSFAVGALTLSLD